MATFVTSLMAAPVPRGKVPLGVVTDTDAKVWCNGVEFTIRTWRVHPVGADGLPVSSQKARSMPDDSAFLAYSALVPEYTRGKFQVYVGGTLLAAADGLPKFGGLTPGDDDDGCPAMWNMANTQTWSRLEVCAV